LHLESPRVLFRWALWKPNPAAIEMLDHSIGTFRHFFGSEADYLVCTDDPGLLAKGLETPAELVDFDVPGAEYLDDRATWLKWAPRFRYDRNATEFRVDADIFLLAEPTELREFIAGDGRDYIVSQEAFRHTWPYGAFGFRFEDEIAPLTADELDALDPAELGREYGYAPINAGFFGQRAGVDLGDEFREDYRWWSEHVRHNEVDYYDEQGAIMWVLRRHVREGRVKLLDPMRYRVVCPNNKVPVESVDGIVAMHSTYPERPAYHKFLSEIRAVSGIGAA